MSDEKVDWALVQAREILRARYVDAAFKNEPRGMKRGGWIDDLADDIAKAIRSATKRTKEPA